MIFIDNIHDLQYYHQPDGVPCYCDKIVYPSDMTLQGHFPPNSGAFTLEVDVMSPDGLTVYEAAASYFEIYYFVNPVTGDYAFNMRLKSFSPAMCLHKCFILRVKILMGTTVVFDKYTERYCQTNCCDIARDVDIEQSGVKIGGSGGTVISASPKITDCGDPIITLTTAFACYDKFTGDVYGIPTDVLSGDASFGLYKFTNMTGRIVVRPREITREYSYNCSLQRVESKKQYLFEGWEYFPAWKMNEIEAQLHSNEIYIDAIRYEYAGGTPFRILHKCREVFGLSTLLEDCPIRQIFGCDNGCALTTNYDGAQAMFIMPLNSSDSYYYGENGDLIATTYAELLNYYRNLNGITGINDIDITGTDCGVYKAFSVNGNGYIPSSFYFGNTIPQNRLFKKILSSFDDICNEFGANCITPVIILLDIVVEDQPCIAPSIDTMTITVEDVTPAVITVVGTAPWVRVDSDTFITKTGTYISLTLKVTSTSIVEDPDNPGDPVFVFSQQIGLLGNAAWPLTQLIFNSDNSSLTGTDTVIINPTGTIYYQGLTTTVDNTHATILFTVNYYI